MEDSTTDPRSLTRARNGGRTQAGQAGLAGRRRDGKRPAFPAAAGLGSFVVTVVLLVSSSYLFATKIYDAAGVVAYADRTGVRSCVGGFQTRRWQYLFRQQSMCSASQVRAGFHVWFWPPDTKVVPGQVLVARLREALVTRLPSAAR